MNKSIFLFLLILLTMSFSFGAEPSNGKSQSSSENDSSTKQSSSNFRCEKLRNASLKELKLTMLDYCNLEKPFSIAAVDKAIESSYTYCCHIK